MRRILIVMTTLLLGSSLFAQTGEVFTKIAGGLVDEASTGFKLNFDAFGLEYKLVKKANILGVDTYSPGYINITGIKAGMFSFGAGLTVRYGYDNIATIKDSNAMYTLVSDTSKMAYAIDVLPRIALNIGKINITTSDQSQFYWAESVVQKYKLSNGNSNIIADSDGRTDKRVLTVKIGANMKGAWNGELGGYNNLSLTWEQSVGAYKQNMSDEVNTWGDVTLPLGSDLDLYLKGWFRWVMYENYAKVVVPGLTNADGSRGSEMYFGPEARLQYKIAGGQVKLNLGIGLASLLHKQSFGYITMSSNVQTNAVTTNAIDSWYTLYGVKRDDDRAFLEFGGSTKFADWEFGMTGRLGLGIALYKKTENPVTKSVAEQWLNDTAPWGEGLFTPIVKDLYLKYSKGMFTANLKLGGLGTSATAPWFSAVELSYKF